MIDDSSAVLQYRDERASTVQPKLRLNLLTTTGDLKRDRITMFTALTGRPPTASELAALREDWRATNRGPYDADHE